MKTVQGRIAYLNSEYPAISHTFIAREIAVLRAAGVDIAAFSVRLPTNSPALNSVYSDEIKATTYLLDSWARLLSFQFYALLHPWRALRTFLTALRVSPPGIRSRVKAVAYYMEAVRLAVELRKRKLDHVHVHMANNGASVARLATVFCDSITYSMTIHGSAEFFDVHNVLLKWKTEGALFVRCISNFCKSQIMAWTNPSAWNRFHIVHCGIDPEEFAPAPMPTSATPLRLITVGRMVPIKGYELLLEACTRLEEQQINWKLTMIGDGPRLTATRRLAEKLNLAHRVDFKGALAGSEVREYLDASDALIVSSFMEGVPVVLMEAMSKQLQVVATRVAGVPELVDDDVTGILVTPGSVEELGEALLRLAGQALPQTGRSMARQKIISEFSLEVVRNGMLDLFERYGIVQNRRSRMQTLDTNALKVEHAI